MRMASLSSLERLTEALDEVKRHCPDLPVLALHWMHVKHPIHPLQEELSRNDSALGKGPDFGIWGRGGVALARLCVGLLYASLLTGRLLLVRLRLRDQIRALKDRSFDLVAKTRCVAPDGLPLERDFYYGNLQKNLQDRGASALMISGHPAGMSWQRLGKLKASASFPFQLPELALVPFSSPFRFVGQQAVACVRLMRFARRVKDPFVRRLALRASTDCVFHWMIPIGLYYWIGQSAVKAWHPKAVVVLYEGYNWEQCLWRGVKAADPACRTVGYQHTILLRHNCALLKSQGNGAASLRPDVVLCLGPRTESMLKSSHSRSDLFPFGTFRQMPAPSTCQEPRPQKQTVLVMPEGYPEEVKLLFHSAIQAARRLPQVQFILRCHPLFPPGRIPLSLREEIAQTPNIRFSTGVPIDKDFAESSVILYRGSSSVLYAIFHGLKPVYLHDDRYREVDPLFELDSWRERARSPEELEQILRRYSEENPERSLNFWRKAREYVEAYMVPVSQASIDRFLDSIGLVGQRATEMVLR